MKQSPLETDKITLLIDEIEEVVESLIEEATKEANQAALVKKE